MVKALIFTVVIPGTATVWIPYLAFWPRHELSLEGMHVIGALVIALGAAFYFWCLWDFTFTGRGTPAPIDPPKVLVARGLYRLVRNPMYVGVLLVMVGESIIFGSWPMLGYALAFGLGFHLFVVLYEEPTLRRQFGAAYEEYARAVPRWIPRLPKPPQT